VGEKCSDKFRLEFDFQRNSRDLMRAANLRHGTDGRQYLGQLQNITTALFLVGAYRVVLQKSRSIYCSYTSLRNVRLEFDPLVRQP
jgi:hypothetical protein